MVDIIQYMTNITHGEEKTYRFQNTDSSQICMKVSAIRTYFFSFYFNGFILQIWIVTLCLPDVVRSF